MLRRTREVFFVFQWQNTFRYIVDEPWTGWDHVQTTDHDIDHDIDAWKQWKILISISLLLLLYREFEWLKKIEIVTDLSKFSFNSKTKWKLIYTLRAF